MKHDDTFDELARRKLEEQSFPFQEAHWAQAEQAILARRRKSRKGFWFAGGLAALLAGIALWWGPGDVPPLENAGRVTEENRSITAEKPEVLSANEEATPAPKITGQGPQEVKKADRTEEAQHSTIPETTERSPRGSGIAKLDAQPRVFADATTPSTQRSAARMPPVQRDPPDDGSDRSAIPIASVPDSEAPDEPIDAAVQIAPVNEDEFDVDGPSLAEVPIAPDPEPATDNTTGTSEPNTEPVTAHTEPTDSLTKEPIDDYVISTPNVPQDSAALESPLQLNPLQASQAPWELAALAGVFQSNSSYTGGGSEDWSGSATRSQTFGAGLELMRMGRNYGIGTGLHYSTYADRIQVNDNYLTDISTTRYWFFAPMATTILVVVDTVDIGGETYYVGEQVDTTLLVFTSAYRTDSTITRVREARASTNTASYFEIPLLFDAHVVQGRWSVGVRGGPTMGLLTTRQGVLPNSNGEGYSTMGDLPLREVMFGYTARAYIRYRWNAAWSVGLEPAIRGQLMNSLGEGPLERRSSAIGGMLSLSYRLR